MNLNNLTPAVGSVKTRKRIGRGTGSGLGGTSTKGHKGQKSRSGYSKKIGFEGGQMPIQRRIQSYQYRNTRSACPQCKTFENWIVRITRSWFPFENSFSKNFGQRCFDN